MISVVVLTKNEEKNIARCLNQLKWADEIIVVDDYSTDDTVRIAKSRGARVFRRKLDNNFAQQRNFALRKAKNKWVFFIDADEIVSPTLANEIVRRVKKDTCDGFYLFRREIFGDKILHCIDKPIWDWTPGPIRLLRLAKKNKGKWVGKVHERWLIAGKIGQLSHPLYHKSFSNLSDALKKINFYSSIRSQELSQKQTKVHWWQIVFYPLAKFLKNFFWHRGFFDGTRGLIFCLLMSLHSFLVRGKLWQLNQR